MEHSAGMELGTPTDTPGPQPSLGAVPARGIGALLLADIDQFVKEQRACKLYTLTQQGKVSAQLLAEYVANLAFLTRRTPLHLEQARRAAVRAGRRAMAEYFQHKFLEEQGHHRWAERDLERLNQRFGVWPRQAPARAMQQLVQCLEESIERDVTEYVPYILFAEYFMVSLGPEWLEMLHQNCDIEASSLTIVSKHVTLDAGHASEGVAAVEQLLTEQDSWPPLRTRLSVFMRLLAAFFEELVEQQGLAEA